MTDQMNEALDYLVDWIVDDYARRARPNPEDRSQVDLFHAGIDFEEGRKYIKVTKKLGNQKMVWGFIVKENEPEKDGKANFKAGDILKPASWSTPARNKPRGNIFQGDFSWVRWTGPEYL
jgi:hypothetical protein